MSEIESLVAIAFLLIAFAVLCYLVGYADAVKKTKGGGQIESMKKARNEAATSKTSIQKLVSKHNLTRMGAKSKWSK
ncbi:TPA: excisionase [Listeria monocytogenes]|uniref:excisionase n=1 Tax=Listeria monocytogenes TaxID=1639 RepID=UPI000E71B479|nr:excisionase [Listeria monocytogenes]EAE6190768.1 excisionase [Listeria monocytogenes]EAK8992430.1 excisionase [Listeria monocytogenes]EAK8995619.1 excisionase [Listeria monocytogenes]EBF5351328.1 excisionase [Listeria monocytogenes]EBF6148474.1 excisionase [Listeria monocytogenes]